jgi:hypothetical protein
MSSKKPTTTKAKPAKDPKAAAAKPAKPAKAVKTFNTKGKDVKPLETFLKSIPVKLSAKEKDERVDKHNKVWKQIGGLEMEKKNFDDNINAKIKKSKAEFDQLMRAMESGIEDQEHKVGLFGVFAANIVHTVRLDTEEILASRTMTAEEKQKMMPKKPGTVTALASVKDENQVKADATAKEKKDAAKAPETADGGEDHEARRKEDDDKLWTD